MIIALAVQKESVAPTLGSAQKMVFVHDEIITETIPCTGNIPLLLKKYHVETLICNGIGNCMMDLLTFMQIKVIPGVKGSVPEVIKQYLDGSLKAGTLYSCADHNRSCGECPGTF